jgi:hypothetical protein
MSSVETSSAAYLQGSLEDLAVSENSDIDILAVTMGDTKATVWVDATVGAGHEQRRDVGPGAAS